MLTTKQNKKEEGVILYLTLVILAFMTSVLTVLVGLAISQTKNIWSASDSVGAFYAADTGIEETLYRIYKEGWVPSATSDCFIPVSPAVWQDLSSEANYVEYNVCTSNSSQYKIWATGRFKTSGTQRKIEIDITP